MGEMNLLDPHAIDDPHGYFRQFRDGGPIQWSDRHRAWIVMGHPELNAAFRDPRLSTNACLASGNVSADHGQRRCRWPSTFSMAGCSFTSHPSTLDFVALSLDHSLLFSERVRRSSAADRR